jgi:hypothetical protein
MSYDHLRLSRKDNWRWFSWVAVHFVAYTFGSIAIVAFGVAVLQLGGEALHWFKTSTWGSSPTVAEFWELPVSSTNNSMRWIIAQPVVCALLEIGVVALVIYSLFALIIERLEAAAHVRTGSSSDW